VKAVYSRSTSSANKLKDAAVKLGYSSDNVKVYSEQTDAEPLSALLARKDIAAVVIALPITSQPDLILQSLAAGKHVLSEKPLAKDVATGKSLLTTYLKDYAPKGLIFSVAENHRFLKDLNQARTWIVDEKRIGTLNQVYFRALSTTGTDAKFMKDSPWRQKPDYQGGFVLDGGVHNVAGLRYVTGQEIVETKGFSAQFATHMEPIDTVASAVRFEKGAIGTVVMSWSSAKEDNETIFVGTEGSVVVLPGKVRLVGKDQKVLEEKAFKSESIKDEIESYLKAIKSGKAEERASAVQAYNDLAAIESIIQGGGKVQLWTG
jgi:predicted dehydrogenase